MTGLDGILENYIKYTNVYPELLNNYMSMYGHDAEYIKASDMSDEYINALGRNKVGFDYSSKNYKYVPIKILSDYNEWYNYYVGQMLSVTLYYAKKIGESNPLIATGDIIISNTLNTQNFYRIIDPPQSFNNIIYKINIKLIQSKIIDKTINEKR